MRDGTSWRHCLVEDFALFREYYGPLPIPVSQLLDSELVLTLMADHLPDQDVSLAWAVLNGYPFPALARLPEESRRAIQIARLRLPALLSRSSWGEMLSKYQSVQPPYPLYQVTVSGISPTHTSILPERLTLMREALEQAPVWRQRRADYAPPGIYRFFVDREPFEVEIPKSLQALSNGTERAIPTSPSLRSMLRVSLDELEQEALWMDEVAPAGSRAARSWAALLKEVRLCLVGSDGLVPTRELQVDGLLHLAGTVGSGKSTLIDILAVYLARRGKRVVIVKSDVASLLREQELFETLRMADPRLQAVPLIGRSTRIIHLNRLAVAEAQEAGLSLSRDHCGYAMLSTVCGLDGLRRDVAPIAPGKEPCTRLYERYPTASNDKLPHKAIPHRYDCPLLPYCPVHRPSRLLLDSSIWLATPSSLLASSPQPPLISERVFYIELVMRAADVVLVDEADLIQVQFDDYFAQTEVLVGQSSSWLDLLAAQVTRQVYRPGRPLVGVHPSLDRWLTAHDNTQRAVNRLYYWFREGTETRTWLGDTYFTGQRLFKLVRRELAHGNRELAPFDQAGEAFFLSRFGSVRRQGGKTPSPTTPDAWIEAIQAELSFADRAQALTVLADWLKTSLQLAAIWDDARIELAAHHLRIALLIGVLDHALHDILDEWSTAEEYLDLDRGSGGLFYAPAESLLRLIPEPPMGAIIGFQYFDPHDRGTGDLRFFHIRAVGRALLYHLHDSFSLSDGIVGPHVILTSATSWAPTSWCYHLAVPPQMVLLPPTAHREAIEANPTADARDAIVTIRCIFEPLPDPMGIKKRLAVSGAGKPTDQIRNLRAMVTQLAQRTGFDNKSRFDRELEQLDPTRRRILLIVGSYVEAEAVAEALTAALGKAPGEAVVALIRPQEGEVLGEMTPGTLYSSRVAQFPVLQATFLVAPLRTIERGHNILIGQEAALGSIYFLKRPMPVPGDLHTAIQRINAWASNQLQAFSDQELTIAGKSLRAKAQQEWEKLLNEHGTYTGFSDRTALLWTELVMVWQCIGRLLRGGVGARVHFVDAKWAEVSSNLKSNPRESETTSMLVGFRRILHEALHDADPVNRALAHVLYAPFANGLETIEGVYLL